MTASSPSGSFARELVVVLVAVRSETLHRVVRRPERCFLARRHVVVLEVLVELLRTHPPDFLCGCDRLVVLHLGSQVRLQDLSF